LVAHAIEKKVNDETIMALYMQEYEEFPSGLAEARKKLADATRKNRWATEFDVNILHNIFNVGIFLINKDDGRLYHSAMEYNGYTHYIVLLNDPGSHYQTIALRPKGSVGPYKYVFSCDDVPQFLKDMVNEEAMKAHARYAREMQEYEGLIAAGASRRPPSRGIPEFEC